MNARLPTPMTPATQPQPQEPPTELASVLAGLRPRLHRYSARMAGSMLDGEDIVQETMIKATQHHDPLAVRNTEAWLFRIAHNTAMDFLRRKALEKSLFSDLPDDDLLAEEPAPPDQREIAALALRTFMGLPIAQRSAVILADVLGYEMGEIVQVTGATLAAVKAALHRGRFRLRELAQRTHDAPETVLSATDQALVTEYARRFNARDFDGLRDMLAEHARLDLVARHKVSGKAEVSNYFGNYAGVEPVLVAAACIEGRPGLLVYADEGAGPVAKPAYGVVLGWSSMGQLESIRDFRYARYATEAMLLTR